MEIGLLLVIVLIAGAVGVVKLRRNEQEDMNLPDLPQNKSHEQEEEITVYTYSHKNYLTLKKDSIVTNWIDSTRVIPIAQIVSIEVKDPKGPGRPGRIIIRQAGSDGVSIRVTSYSSYTGSNNLEFPHDYAYTEEAHRIQAYIAAYHSSRVPASVPAEPVSAADEIRKYKELLDMGAITQEEYEQKKEQLLSL